MTTDVINGVPRELLKDLQSPPIHAASRMGSSSRLTSD